MYSNVYDEFPHTVIVKGEQWVKDEHGDRVKVWQAVAEIEAFVDTPSTSKRVDYSKMNMTAVRDMYTAEPVILEAGHRLEFEGKDYLIDGDVDGESQGGLNEVFCYPLKKVT